MAEDERASAGFQEEDVVSSYSDDERVEVSAGGIALSVARQLTEPSTLAAFCHRTTSGTLTGAPRIANDDDCTLAGGRYRCAECISSSAKRRPGGEMRAGIRSGCTVMWWLLYAGCCMVPVA
eukprot:365930-Chlamydomonas_euryale.AAC.16